MQTIKGYTLDEARELAQLAECSRREGGRLGDVFATFAKSHCRAKGSVRNFYYELSSMCSKNHLLEERIFTCRPHVSTPEYFTEQQKIALVTQVCNGRAQGKSVRRVLKEISGGDDKLMLRYQNKYRNMLRTERELVDKIAEQFGQLEASEIKAKVPYITLKQLKIEINNLVESIAEDVKKENLILKKRVEELSEENTSLKERINLLSACDRAQVKIR